jgi:outer membrane biosynthesis protein TonB
VRILLAARPGAILEDMNRVIQFRGSIALLCSLAAACALAPCIARADDLKLKDGTKISGAIVGFEDNSFKVKTSYGFALVQKDQVVSIGMSDAPKTAAEKKPEPMEEKAPASEKPKPEPVVASSTPSAPASKPAPLSAPPPMPNPVAASKPIAPGAPAPAAPSAAKNSAPTEVAPASTTAEVVAPPKPPAPEPIREQVTGNTYTNETYRFHMYKPPDWDVIASAPAVLPGAITAMGTADDTTYLLIGQEASSKPLAAEMDATEHRLRDLMENFRPLGEEKITVSGLAAMEHHFRGSVDQHDWSGVVVLIPRGGKVYTVFGMTRADNDLFQLQENVISRAIASLQFSD